MWYQENLFKNLVLTACFFLVVFLVYLLLPLLDSIFGFVLQIFTPFVLAIILYYLFRPLVRKLTKWMSITLAISVVYLILLLAGFFIGMYVYPKIQGQISVLESINLEQVMSGEPWQVDIFHIKINVTEEINKMTSKFLSLLNSILFGHIADFFTFVTQLVITLVITPFILYYLFTDDERIYRSLHQRVPEKYSNYVNELFSDFDDILLHFVTSRVLVSLIVNSLIFLAFMSIGLKYTLFLVIISTIFYIIPTFGSFLAMILPLFVGFSTSTFMGMEVLIILGVAMTLEGFFLTPLIMGRKLYMHPLTVIFILLAAGSLYGIFGLLFATPAYAIVKAFCNRTYSFVKN